MSDRRAYKKRAWNIHSAERYDVLEEDLPREACQVRGCSRQARYEWHGRWEDFWLCPRHRPLYRDHDEILKRIHNS